MSVSTGRSRIPSPGSWGRATPALASALVLAALACHGSPDEPVKEVPLPARVWLLSDAQYSNAVRDLLGDVEIPAVRTPGVTGDQFIHEAALHRVSGPLLGQYQAAAERAAQQAAGRLDRILPCDPAVIGEDGCARAFIDHFVSRAFRRPLDDAEREQLIALFESGRESADADSGDGGLAIDGFSAGIALVIEATLQAPTFLYRAELGGEGDADGVVTLTPHELAAQLSFLFLDSIPDDPLWAAAEDGSLGRSEVLAAQVDRLLAMPRVREHLGEVVLTWLGIPEVLTVPIDRPYAPEFDEDLRRSMMAESRLFVRDVLWSRDGTLGELLTSSRTFLDARLAEHYGVDGLPALDGVASGEHVAVELDPAQRAGILTHGSFLSATSVPKFRSIVHRGLAINRALLCLPEPPSPPLELLAAAAPEVNRLDVRERSQYRLVTPVCASCHETIDPLGIAFENFDLIGRWQTEGVSPVTAVDHGDGELVLVQDAVELAALLARSDRVAACVVDQMMQQALGRELGDDSAVSRRYVEDRFEASDRDLVEIFRRIPETRAFRARYRSQRQKSQRDRSQP